MAILSQLPSDVDLSFVSGDTFRIRLRVVDPTTGAAIPLADHSFVAEIGKQADRSIVAQFEVTDDPDAPGEAVILSLSKSETAALPSVGNGTLFNGVWDLEVTFPNTDVRTVASGSVRCQIDVSNRAVTP